MMTVEPLAVKMDGDVITVPVRQSRIVLCGTRKYGDPQTGKVHWIVDEYRLEFDDDVKIPPATPNAG